jgi:hypothetical protein
VADVRRTRGAGVDASGGVEHSADPVSMAAPAAPNPRPDGAVVFGVTSIALFTLWLLGFRSVPVARLRVLPVTFVLYSFRLYYAPPPPLAFFL